MVVLRQTGVWKSSGDVKPYSTGPPAGPETDPPKTQHRPERSDNEDAMLFDIAMEGTSPKAREQRGHSARRKTSKVVEQELKWLKDPRALADRVGRLLRSSYVAMAAALVRAAQKEDMECSVAWNHLLEYSMDKGSPRSAFKFYNEMKKRGRKPNSMTYTIMLSGLSKAPRNSGLDPVKTALSIYRSIFAENSKVEPSIIHSNAMLAVCARQGDMDTLWQIAGELPEEGPGSPDPFTYTTILRGITDATHRDVKDMSPKDVEQIMAAKAQGITEGKRVWTDVVYRWKKGQHVIDNYLVSTMGRFLLDGPSYHDCYDVLALFNQTAGIPILATEPLKGSYNLKPATSSGGSRGGLNQANKELEDVPFVDEGERLYRPPKVDSETLGEQEEGKNFDNLFDPVVPDESPSGTTVPSYISVGNRELSIILEACLTMPQALGSGKAYWHHLTQENHRYKVEPDAASFHQYLRLLRAGRSSRATVEVMQNQIVPSRLADGKAFHIAFSCCRRDRRNINILKNANELLRLMDKSCVLPDPRALDSYLVLINVLKENPQLLVSMNGLNGNQGGSSKNLAVIGRELQVNLHTNAIEHLRPHIAKLEKALEHSSSLRAANKKNRDAVPGTVAVKIMLRTRALVDEALKPENAKLLSKPLSQEYENLSQELRKYSKSEMAQKYNGKLVAPTPEQLLAFSDQQDGEAPSKASRA
ncbi:hypothetical protein EYZ11_010061 [Aspergillus tanneri]|uniref:Pentacotripeptide-repeat region of PRORP domain-containing protein n=1 Tax=Aspergillus tanneri TaxID=1220188 RepID=A0A4S3J6T4_9EURO|nr:uncharacterized protein ATNIH1004_003274 [Aspergillus tanneri]KAA8650587.1 hypothetical protein ATNIH1004_003274 [Aspergillus tanneri]THC90482.1 hypothetical protein EYZ11_010061 [Aspergillus tanneri]